MRDANRVRRLVEVRERVRDLKRAHTVDAERRLMLATQAAASAARHAEQAHRALVDLELVDVMELETRSLALVEAQRGRHVADEHARLADHALAASRDDLVSAEIDVRSLGLVEERLLREEARRSAQREQREQDEQVSLRRSAR